MLLQLCLTFAISFAPLDDGTIELKRCACPDPPNFLPGEYRPSIPAGFPRLITDPEESFFVDEFPDNARKDVRRLALAKDGFAKAKAHAGINDDNHFGETSGSSSASAFFIAEKRWQWVPETEEQPPTPNGVEIAASYSISGHLKGYSQVGSDDGFFDDVAHAGALASYAALFDLTCFNTIKKNHTLIVTSTNTTSSGKGGEAEAGLEKGDNGRSIGVSGAINVTRVYGQPIKRKTVPILGGGVVNIETDANVVILRRAGAVTASAYATSNGNYGRATSEVELTVEFIKPQLFLCSERGTPPDGPIEPVPDPVGDEDDDDGTGGGGDDGGVGGGGDNGGVGS